MRILLNVKINTFLSNAVFTFMKYSKNSGTRNLNTTRTSTWDINCIQDFCHGSTQYIMCILWIIKHVSSKIRKFQLRKYFNFQKRVLIDLLCQYKKKRFLFSSLSIYDFSIVSLLIFTNYYSMMHIYTICGVWEFGATTWCVFRLMTKWVGYCYWNQVLH